MYHKELFFLILTIWGMGIMGILVALTLCNIYITPYYNIYAEKLNKIKAERERKISDIDLMLEENKKMWK